MPSAEQNGYPEQPISISQKLGYGKYTEYSAEPAPRPQPESEKQRRQRLKRDYLEEQEQIEKLGYEPFDPEKELLRIRRLTPNQKILPPEQKLAIRKERLKTYKENREKQQRGIARILIGLEQTIYEFPNLDANTLYDEVESMAPPYRLTPKQLEAFKNGIKNYHQKHQAVEYYRQKYPNDKYLFEANFGTQPSGLVRVAKGPMTLHFQCFSKDDYAIAYNFDKIQGNPNKMEMEDVTRALSTGGRALSSGRIDELWGTLTIENVNTNQTQATEYQKESKKMSRTEELNITLEDQNHVVILVDSQLFDLAVLEKNQGGYAQKVKLSNLSKPDDKPLGLVRGERGWQEVGDPSGFSQDSLQHNFGRSANGEHWMSLDIGLLTATIYDYSASGAAITYQRKIEQVDIKDKKWSEVVRVHEEQHQFNNLFTPLSLREDFFEVLMKATEREVPLDLAVKNLIYDLAKRERATLIDNTARNEILAYYKDGSKPADIYQTLATNPIYDYKKRSPKELAQVPKRIKEEIEENMYLIEETLWPDGEKGGSDFPLAIPLDQASSTVDKIFGEGYRDDLKEWTGCITALEQKGYSRDEIMAMFYPEPLYRWDKIARRANAKNN